jgi:hypothetical protein
MLVAGEIGEPVSGIDLVVPVSTDIVARSSRLVLDLYSTRTCTLLCSFVQQVPNGISLYIKLIESHKKTVDRHKVVVSDLRILREGARKVGEQGQG